MKTIYIECLSEVPYNFTGIAIKSNGDKIWYQDGRFHRVDGPAIEEENGKTRAWLQNGKRHRTDGPAYEDESGLSSWWQNGKNHRADGPATIWEDGSADYWINGKQVTKETQEVYLFLFPELIEEEKQK